MPRGRTQPIDEPVAKSPEFLAYKDRLEAEIASQAAGNPPQVYYDPCHSANGHVEGGRFVNHGTPDGFEIDVAAWEAAGRTGSAPLRPAAQRYAIVIGQPGDLTSEERALLERLAQRNQLPLEAAGVTEETDG